MQHYARFFKCDLHMHSPVDHSWRDETTRIGPNATEEDERRATRLYMEACYNAGLEIIAIVDHNFAPTVNRSLLPALQDANHELAEKLGRRPIIILPGFEIECRVGRGGHVVCIFEPDMPLEKVNDAASKLLPAERFVGDQPVPALEGIGLPKVLELVQEASRGLVVAAHPAREKGILSEDTAAHWWRQAEFVRPDLYAVESNKPPDKINPGTFLRRVLDNEDQFYRRQRPVACVLVSDCKSLEPMEAEAGNFIGCRSTWIKMSRPSVEGLRQAFLARESHIRYGADSPDSAYVYPRISYVKATGGFLQVPKLRLSPNLNCVIGGRGAGKSALVDAIRATAGRFGDEIPETVLEKVRNRLDKTATDADIEVGVETPAGRRRLILKWDSGQSAVTVFDADGNESQEVDLRTLLPARFLSQGEIDALADKPEEASQLLDDFVSAQLRDVQHQETEVRTQLDQMDIEIQHLMGRVAEKSRVQTEIDELRGTLGALQEVEGPLRAWHNLEQADKTLQTAKALGEDVSTSLEQALARVREALDHVKSLRIESGENAEPKAAAGMAAGLLGTARVALTIVEGRLREAQAGLLWRLAGEGSIFRTRMTQHWHPILADAEAEHNRLKAQLRDQGLDPDRYEELRQQLAAKVSVAESIVEAERELEARMGKRQALVDKLYQVWGQATRVRRAKASELNEKLRRVLRIEVSHQRRWQDLAKQLDAEGLWRDRRSVNETDRERLFTVLCATMEEDTPVAKVFVGAMRQLLRDGTGPVTELWGNKEKKTDALRDWLPEEVLRKVETFSVRDEVRITVLDRLGNPIGDLAHVSAGQQGFTVLSLLLAEGQGPLIVDTPEEGLDNEGVYQLLVPLLREKKETRQIVLVTHNANIPVNADAELIVALEAAPVEDGQLRGQVKQMDVDDKSVEAVGALDRKGVAHAVVDIMEGSEDAFSRRRAKYGY